MVEIKVAITLPIKKRYRFLFITEPMRKILEAKQN